MKKTLSARMAMEIQIARRMISILSDHGNLSTSDLIEQVKARNPDSPIYPSSIIEETLDTTIRTIGRKLRALKWLVRTNANCKQIEFGVTELGKNIAGLNYTGEFIHQFRNQVDPGKTLDRGTEQPPQPKPAMRVEIIDEPEDFEKRYDVPSKPAINLDRSREIQGLTELLTDLADDVATLTNNHNRVSAELAELKRNPATATTIKIEHYNGTSIEINETVPENFQKILGLATCRRNILLVGPAGSGKSTVAELVAKSLELPFGAIACTSGMSESQLTGRSIPNIATGESKYVNSPFVECFENGGIFLLDELDAADPNVLLILNGALSNGIISLPLRDGSPIAKRHKDFIVIATANTFGRGGSRTYAGRNALDESTLDRFRIGIVECDYDSRIEAKVCPNTELRNALLAIRRIIKDKGIKRIMSSRYMKDAYTMTQHGWSVTEVVATFTQDWSEEELRKLRG